MHPYVAHNRFLRKNKRTRHQTSTENVTDPSSTPNFKRPDPEQPYTSFKRASEPDSPVRGEIVKGQISRVVNFGAFVRVGDLTGLVHLSELGWKRIADAGELVSEGQTFDFKVMNFDPETQRLALSRKALLPNPWIQIRQHYPVGSKVKGRVSRFSSHGVFVSLGEEIEGYIPLDELAWETDMPEAADLLQVEQEVELVVLNADSRRHKVSLSLKRACKAA
ncbi:MAG: S1 RNA-binding domain-containing protein [Pseudomonadota bacterium]|nr:S1 RNA-binding domain-containing protein [Pseudomonadota bacterium]